MTVHMTCRHILIAAATIMLMQDSAPAEQLPDIGPLDPRGNAVVKQIRDDIRKTIFTVKSRRDAGTLPPLSFFRYRVRKDDTFWTILSRTSLDMDTLISVNGLSTPRDIQPGKTIFIPNMRGIIISPGDENNPAAIAREHDVDPSYVAAVNNDPLLEKPHLFIPCGKISSLERSLFIGTGFMSPLTRGRRTSGFGMRRDPFGGRGMRFHAGIDIACPVNSPVYAAREGTVISSGYEDGYGLLVVIRHEHGYRSYYGHLKNSVVRPGQKVARGDRIGLSGNTGRTTGPHLHFEIRREGRPVNPGLLVRR